MWAEMLGALEDELTFSDKIEPTFLHHSSQATIKTSLRLRQLVTITWSFGAWKNLLRVLAAGNYSNALRLIVLQASILLVVLNAAWVAYAMRLGSPTWKRIHDERIKIWTWQVTLVGVLVGSVLNRPGENGLASPLANFTLLSLSLCFEQIRWHISVKLFLMQLLGFHLAEATIWVTKVDNPGPDLLWLAARDSICYWVLGVAAPLLYLAIREARTRLQFLKQHKLDEELLSPAWQLLVWSKLDRDSTVDSMSSERVGA